MIRLEVSSNISGMGDRMERQLKFATAMALTWTAKQVRESTVDRMRKVFDRPTPYTLNALYVKPASVRDLYAEVWHKNPSLLEEHYLIPQIEGGTRAPRKWERGIAAGEGVYLMPGQDLRRDAYGNIGRGQIVRILSGLRRFSEVGYSANARSSAAAERYIYLPQARGRRPAGVYQRYSTDLDRARYFAAASMARRKRRRLRADQIPQSGLHLILYVTRKAPQYKVRLPFYEIARQVREEYFMRFFEASYRYAIETARK